jgi:hypothetical protein
MPMPCDITLSGCQDLNLRPSTSAVGRGFAVVRRSPSAQVKRHTERRRTVADQPDKGAMVVRMVVKNRCRACLYADLWSSFRLSLSVTMSRRVMPLSGVPTCGVPLCAVPQGVRDMVQAGIDDSACQDSAIWLESSPDDVESELVQARKRGQSAQGKVPTGTSRPSAIRGMRRCRHA